MAKKKRILYPVFFMVLVTVIFTGALALLNEATIERIEALEQLKKKESILYAAGVAYDDPEEAYEEMVTTSDIVTYTEVFEVSENGTTKAYVFEYTGDGLWGTITGYIALSPSLDELVGVDFLKHSETPGLGGRIDEQWFKDQFRDFEIDLDGGALVEYAPNGDSEIDAIAGATSTSEAVRKIFNKEIIKFVNQAKEAM